MQDTKQDTLVLSDSVIDPSCEITYAFRGHSQVSGSMISRNWMPLRSRLDQLVQVADGANLVDRKGFD